MGVLRDLKKKSHINEMFFEARGMVKEWLLSYFITSTHNWGTPKKKKRVLC
jgi:hypothetical protein